MPQKQTNPIHPSDCCSGVTRYNQSVSYLNKEKFRILDYCINYFPNVYFIVGISARARAREREVSEKETIITFNIHSFINVRIIMNECMFIRSNKRLNLFIVVVI